jgi:hypothetical protein
MTFVFAETQGMQSAAASASSLADDTNSAGAQGQAAGAVVQPPGLDHVSAGNAARIKKYTSEVATTLAGGAGLQAIYGNSISNSAGAYLLTDELNATGLGGLV